MMHHGFVRLAVATPALRVADCPWNAGRIVEQMHLAREEGVAVLVFPELSLTGFIPNHPQGEHEAWLREALQQTGEFTDNLG